MKTIKFDSIYEETRYCWICPECEEIAEECEDPELNDDVMCTHCNTIVTVVE